MGTGFFFFRRLARALRTALRADTRFRTTRRIYPAGLAGRARTNSLRTGIVFLLRTALRAPHCPRPCGAGIVQQRLTKVRKVSRTIRLRFGVRTTNLSRTLM